MKYLATNVRIFTDTNSRGEYHWMSMNLFNDQNPKANPSRLPTYYITLDIIVNAFLECKEALSRDEKGDWLNVDMSKVPDKGLTAHHLEDVQPEVVALDGYYQPIYRRDYTDSKNVKHTKGSVRVGSNGLPLPAVNQLKVYVQYFLDEKIVDGQKVMRYTPVEEAYDIAMGVLARSYRKMQTIAPVPKAEEPEPEPEDDAEKKAAERAELEERLKALG